MKLVTTEADLLRTVYACGKEGLGRVQIRFGV